MNIKKSIFIIFVEKYLNLAITFVGVMLMARLLTPKEIGIYSVASAVTGIAQMLRDFGVGNYLIQERDLTKDKIRTALSVTSITSWTVGIMLYAARPWIVEFYHEPGLNDLIAVQCISFIILPFSAPILALLRRDMQFGVLFRINLLTCITQFVISISLAASGYGYMSMAWATVASLCCTALLVTANRPKQAWLLPGFKEWRQVASFGIQSSFTAIITEIAVSTNDLVMGKFLGFQSVALFSRAQGLMNLFHRDMMEAIRKVAFPAFAKAVREEQDLLQGYLRAINYVTVFAWPFYAFLGLYTQPIIKLMFGNQWDAAVPLVKILVFAGAIAALWSLFSNALLALGQINKIMRVEIITQTVRVILIVYAAMQGVEMVCYALLLVYILQLFVSLKYLKLYIGLTFYKLIISNINSFFVMVISMSGPVIFYLKSQIKLNDFQLIFFNGMLLLFGWLIAVFVFRHPVANDLKSVFVK